MLFFLQRFVEKGIRSVHPPQKISKPRLFFIFFINQTSLVNIYAENTAKLQSRAGRAVFGGVQPEGTEQQSMHTAHPPTHPNAPNLREKILHAKNYHNKNLLDVILNYADISKLVLHFAFSQCYKNSCIHVRNAREY